MREILFRGKRVYNGEWVCDNSVLFFTKTTIIYGALNKWREIEVILETVGQYTGLNDKNGKKIFEGDIMPVWEQGEEYYYKVIYNGDCFMLGQLDSTQGSYPLSVKCNICEVIGNVYDNPELLER